MEKSCAFEALTGETGRDYHLTIIDSRSLMRRLATEISFAAARARQLWPELKNDPIGFGIQLGVSCKDSLFRWGQRPNSVASGLAAVAVVSLVVGLAFLGEASGTRSRGPGQSADTVTEIHMLDVSAPLTRIGSGIRAGARGRVGAASGLGEGSKPEPKSSRGGGGSGNLYRLPTQRGRLFQPAPVAAVMPPRPVRKNPALPLAGIDIDPMLWKDQALPDYGDPRSNNADPSRGPGEGGNFGIGTGVGLGEGDGAGFGPGEKGNIGGNAKSLGSRGTGGASGNNPDHPDHIFKIPEVTRRVRILIKPEPQYTEEARRAQATGTVVLRVVFSRSGEVTNIRATHSLPFGLTERAIAAARQIRFEPALKDNRPVSVYMQLEYNFNLY